MKKYVSRPIVIEAAQWNGTTIREAKEFCEKHGMPEFRIGAINGMTGLIIPTLEGNHVASKGDYIVKGTAGEYYPVKPDIFEYKYAPVEDGECRQG